MSDCFSAFAGKFPPIFLNIKSILRKCAQTYKKGKYDPDYFCNHFEDKDRGWEATINSMELAEALDAGYRVTKIFRAYCWRNEDMDDGLFKEYVRKFLRLKYISSGWPAEIKNLEGAAQIKAMREYCAKANEEFGIGIKPRDIQYNPGLKFIGKLMLNCGFIFYLLFEFFKRFVGAVCLAQSTFAHCYCEQ